MGGGFRYFDLGSDAGGTERFVDVDADLPFVESRQGLVFRPVVGENVLVNLVSFEREPRRRSTTTRRSRSSL